MPVVFHRAVSNHIKAIKTNAIPQNHTTTTVWNMIAASFFQHLLRRLGRASLHACMLVLSITCLVEFSYASDAHAAQSVRLSLGRYFGSVELAADDLRIFKSNGDLVSSEQRVVIQSGAGGLAIGGQSIDSDVIFAQSKDAITFQGRKYRYVIEVRWRNTNGPAEIVVIHPIDLEEYVVGTIASEISPSWPLEALKAQAVAARTYAIWQKYNRINNLYHLETTTADQVYFGISKETPETRRAAEETAGLLLTYQHRPARTFFHASCGDHTEDPRNVWGISFPYMPGSPCGACKVGGKSYSWSATFSQAEIDHAFKSALGASVQSISVGSRTNAGRATSVSLSGAGRHQSISGNSFRQALGSTRVMSTMITGISKKGGRYTISGKGYGHGVGMCQWGAYGFAQNGKTAEEILQIYYPGTKLEKIY